MVAVLLPHPGRIFHGEAHLVLAGPDAGGPAPAHYRPHR